MMTTECNRSTKTLDDEALWDALRRKKRDSAIFWTSSSRPLSGKFWSELELQNVTRPGSHLKPLKKNKDKSDCLLDEFYVAEWAWLFDGNTGGFNQKKTQQCMGDTCSSKPMPSQKIGSGFRLRIGGGPTQIASPLWTKKSSWDPPTGGWGSGGRWKKWTQMVSFYHPKKNPRGSNPP